MKKALLIIAIILLAGLLTQFIRWRLARADEAEANFILPKIMVATLQLEQYDPEATRIAMKMRLENNAPSVWTSTACPTSCASGIAWYFTAPIPTMRTCPHMERPSSYCR